MDYNSATAPLTKHDRQVVAGKRKPHHKPKPAPAPKSPGPLAGLNLDYSQPLGRHDLKQYVNAAVRTRFGGETQHLNQANRQLPAWYENYRTALQQGMAQSNAAYGSAIDQQRAASTAAVQRDAAAGADPNAAAAQRQQSDAFANLLASQSLSAQNRFRDLTAISQGQQIQDAQRLRDAMTELRGQKDAFRVSTVGDLIDRERQYGLEQQAFGLDTFKAQADAANDAANRRQSAREHRQDRRDKRTDRATDLALKLHDADGDGVPDSQDPAPSTPGDVKPGSGGLSPSERRQRRKEDSQTMAALNDAIHAVQAAGDDEGISGLSGKALRDAIGAAVRSGQYDPRLNAKGQPLIDPNSGAKVYTGSKVKDTDMLSAALDYFLTPDHHISKRNRKILRGRGAKKHSLRPYRPKPGRDDRQKDRPGLGGH